MHIYNTRKLYYPHFLQVFHEIINFLNLQQVHLQIQTLFVAKKIRFKCLC